MSVASDRYREFAALIRAWCADAGVFVRDLFGVEPTPQQAAILRAVDSRGRVAVKSGHGVGKTAVEAWLTLRQVLCWPDSRCPCTAPAGPQLEAVLWPEIAKWRGRMPPVWRDLVELSDRVVRHAQAPDAQFAVARTARRDQPEALQGFHAAGAALLWICEEASGIDETLWPVIVGSLSSPANRILLATNPTRSTGFVFDAFGRNRDQWECLTLSSEDSPLGGREYAEQVARQFGRDSQVYRVRVLGEFPTAAQDTLIPLWAVAAAQAAERPGAAWPADCPRLAGLDVARFGDDRTALVVRQGGRVCSVTAWSGADTAETTARCLAEWGDGEFDQIAVDTTGGLGAGVADQLRQAGVPAHDANVSEGVPGRADQARLRDALWFRCAEWLTGPREDQSRPDLAVCLPAGPPDSHAYRLAEDLVGIKRRFTPAGKLQAEAKDDMRKRLGRSPDYGDALCLTFLPDLPGYGSAAGAAEAGAVRLGIPRLRGATA